MKDRVNAAVVEEHMRPVIGLRAGALRRKARLNAIGQTEQLQALIDEVWSEIVPESGPCARLLAPSGADVRPVAIEVRFEMHDLAERAARDEIFQREKVAVPTPVVKDGDDPARRVRQLHDVARLIERERERLVDDDVLAARSAALAIGACVSLGV